MGALFAFPEIRQREHKRQDNTALRKKMTFATVNCIYHSRDRAGQNKTRQEKRRQGKTRQDKTRQDKTRQDKTRQDRTRQDKTGM